MTDQTSATIMESVSVNFTQIMNRLNISDILGVNQVEDTNTVNGTFQNTLRPFGNAYNYDGVDPRPAAAVQCASSVFLGIAISVLIVSLYFCRTHWESLKSTKHSSNMVSSVFGQIFFICGICAVIAGTTWYPDPQPIVTQTARVLCYIGITFFLIPSVFLNSVEFSRKDNKETNHKESHPLVELDEDILSYKDSSVKVDSKKKRFSDTGNLRNYITYGSLIGLGFIALIVEMIVWIVGISIPKSLLVFLFSYQMFSIIVITILGLLNFKADLYLAKGRRESVAGAWQRIGAFLLLTLFGSLYTVVSSIENPNYLIIRSIEFTSLALVLIINVLFLVGVKGAIVIRDRFGDSAKNF